MLISKIEKNGFIEVLYESSNIVRSTYNIEDKTLGIVFKSGVEYFYEDVSSKDYYAFELADSQGKVFNTKIKSHTFTKGGDVNVDLIKESIRDKEKFEITSLKKHVVSLCKAIDNYDTSKIDELVKTVDLIKKLSKSNETVE